MKKNKNNLKQNSSKKAVNLPTYKLEQSGKIDITANSGMFLLGEFLKQVDLLEQLSKLNIFQRKKIDEAVHMLALVLNQFSGGDAIRDTQYVKEDPALGAIFGDIHIPAPHTSGDFLERFTQDYIEKFREILQKFQDKMLKKIKKRLGTQVRVSLDSSIYEVFGNTKEGTAASYKKVFGYHPLLLHLHDTGELLDIYLREGNAFTSADGSEMLNHNLSRLAKHFNRIILLADAGFFDQKIVNGLEELERHLCKTLNRKIEIRFIITSEINTPLRERLKDGQLKWEKSEEEDKVRQRDSHTINYRLESLRKALVRRNKTLKRRGELEIAEFEHMVPSWEKSYRFVFKRQEILIETNGSQMDLLENSGEYFYHGYVTNIKEVSKEEIICLIDGRGNQEKFIEDFKNGLGTVHIPSKHFYGNYAYFLISMLSWNLKYWILYRISPDNLIRWKRFRYLFVKVGAQIIKSSRYVIIRFGKGFKRYQEFVEHFERMKQYSLT